MASNEPVRVEQCDRAAMVSYEALSPVPLSIDFGIAVQAGKHDDDPRVQFFARHRTLSQADGRREVARCIEIVRETREGFLSPQYATGQPLSSFHERFACDQCADAIESEFGMGTNEQCHLLGKPTPGEQCRAPLTEVQQEKTMTKREVEIRARLLRHQANGCTSAIGDWEMSSNTDMAKIAIPALRARFVTLNAEANGLDALVEQWDYFGEYFA